MAPPQIRSGLPWGNAVIGLINNAIAKILDASTTIAGLVRLATTTETTTGTATDIATTPAGVKAVIDALKAAANTWTAAQTISLTTTGAALTLVTSDDGAAIAPDLVSDRNSASPAVNDVIGRMIFRGRDSGGNATDYGTILGFIVDPTDSSEDGQVIIQTVVAGTVGNTFIVASGARIGSPTGGDKGAGTLNIKSDLYKDGTKVVGARVTGYTNAMTGTANRATSYATSTITLVQLAERVKAIEDDLIAHGLIGA